MTNWSQAVAEQAMVLIDDVQLNEQMQKNPARFFWRMAMYVRMAYPMLNRPPELLQYLESAVAAPTFSEIEWESDAESVFSQTEVQTGVLHADLVSVVQVCTEGDTVVETPASDFSYDAETGVVTFPPQLGEGLSFVISAYTDGVFPALSPSQMRLLGLAVAIVWDERFTRNWLNLSPKLKDPSFEIGNEANYTEKSQARLASNRSAFYAELKKYEQDCAYISGVSPFVRDRMTLI